MRRVVRRAAPGMLGAVVIVLGVPSAAVAGGEAAPLQLLFTTPGSTPFVVPAGVCRIQVVATGASGGEVVGIQGGPAGAGGRVTAEVDVEPGLSLTVTVGGQGGNGYEGGAGAGGAGGGGAGGVPTLFASPGGGGGGGGLSGIFDGGTPLVVAGGGGGSGGAAGPIGNSNNGDGGRDGTDGTPAVDAGGGGGATQAAGGAGGSSADADATGGAGSAFQGGAGGGGGIRDDLGAGGGGGGGGYYGGGGGGAGLSSGGGGGGGSSFGPSGAVFDTGVNSGNGSVSVVVPADQPSGCGRGPTLPPPGATPAPAALSLEAVPRFTG